MAGTVTAQPGQSFKVNATVVDAAGAPFGGTTTWTSSNPAVATVVAEQDGASVSCLTVGTATITCSNGTASQTVTVNVAMDAASTITLQTSTPQ